MALKRFNSPYQRLIALWVIRAFAPGFGKVAFVSKDGFNDPDLAMFLGFPRQPTPDELKAAPRMLDELKASLEKSPAVLPARARANFSKLAATLKLRPEELQILEFYACKGVTPMLEYTWQVLCLSTPGLDPARFLDQILGISRHGVTKAVSSKGRLIRCGLLKGSGLPSVDGPLRFHSDALAKHLFREAFDPCKLLRSFGVIMPPPAELGVGDFPHLRKTMDVLLPYLKSVRHSRKAGVNILIYGKPGTGKSQLARVMAKETGTPVFELDTADEDGDPLRASARLSALNLAQSYFQDDPVILVFDEAEDILTPSPRDRGMANSHKGWFNQMLGNNRQPVCWISNSIESLDPAFARRFDFILEVPIPPKAQRDRILQDQVGKLVSPALIGQLAGIEELAPAVVTRARDVIRRGGVTIMPAELEDQLSRHPLVQHAAIVALPDERLGERACACIVPRGPQAPDLDALNHFLTGQGVPAYLLPEFAVCFEEFPRTPSLKVKKAELVQLVQARLGAAPARIADGGEGTRL